MYGNNFTYIIRNGFNFNSSYFYKGLLKCGFINISVADLQYCLKIVKQLHDCTVETFGFPTHFNVKVLI